MLQSFQLFAKALRTLLAPRSNPQMGSHPHQSHKKTLLRVLILNGADYGALLELYNEIIKPAFSTPTALVLFNDIQNYLELQAA